MSRLHTTEEEGLAVTDYSTDARTVVVGDQSNARKGKETSGENQPKYIRETKKTEVDKKPKEEVYEPTSVIEKQNKINDRESKKKKKKLKLTRDQKKKVLD